ncbi:hypothetical protein VTN77DRAFT_6503 [Rasamsonia byssochlamydoides]|uniref:uncharacterized protein n=1 Tax=Rasamsonia byssochlamydoides TaxID=89139 RepID=UPI003744915E
MEQMGQLRCLSAVRLQHNHLKSSRYLSACSGTAIPASIVATSGDFHREVWSTCLINLRTGLAAAHAIEGLPSSISSTVTLIGSTRGRGPDREILIDTTEAETRDAQYWAYLGRN